MLETRLRALKTETEKRSRQAVAEVKLTMSAAPDSRRVEPLRILHLSDLHLTGERTVDQLLQPIAFDLGELKAVRLDYLVVSGDLADKCNPRGFERCAEFLRTLLERFGLNASRLIVVPGNHDLDRNRNVYDLSYDQPNDPILQWLKQGEVYLIRNEREYPRRFELFRHCYKGITQEDYPEAPELQGMVIPYADDGIEFLTLNTAWQIDRFHPERISIHPDALSKALLKSAVGMKLRIVVWHHAVYGGRQVANLENIERLIQAGYRVCLHGDLHMERDNLLNHLDSKRSLHVIGTGTYASLDGLRQYNLLEIDRDFRGIRVRSRAQRKLDGPFEPHAVYPDSDDPDVRRGDYWIDL